MPSSDNILLITGMPGTGKTTIIKRVIQSFPELPKAGFYTEEIKANNIRQGFNLVTMQGARYTMAHISISSGHRVGRYGVAVAAIERAVTTALAPGEAARLYIVDEIGKMECLSPLFVQRMTSLLDSGNVIVATVAMKGSGFVAAVKKRPGVKLWEVTEKNRDAMPARIGAWIRERYG